MCDPKNCALKRSMMACMFDVNKVRYLYLSIQMMVIWRVARVVVIQLLDNSQKIQSLSQANELGK